MAQNRSAQGGGSSAQGRPSVLDTASTTQMEELEQQFAEGDHSAWNTLTESYGWSREQADETWSWFSERPGQGSEGGQGGETM